ncbi:sensor histidine kinase [Leptolyngbya sp. NIES-2104]|uniref:sensor histidine kinase n=1 Tax=Leptolyngbya sp. NIES-2104 TaxID=1552121 RepID=UPI0009EC9473|nr:HAMP domain-containing sensor histidine kinase [Leptolyngbya sp. NIES-2104]
MKRHRSSVDRHSHSLVKHSQLGHWRRFFSKATTRILAWYFILTACSGLVAILVTREIFWHRMEQQAEQTMLRKVEVFRSITRKQNSTAQPPFSDDLAAALDMYFSRYYYVPATVEVADSAIAVIDGKIARSTPQTRLDLLNQRPDLIKDWSQLTQPRHGEIAFVNESCWLYRVEPIQLGNKQAGVLVILYNNAVTTRQTNNAVLIVFEVATVVFIIAAVIAWRTARQVLAPLRMLTQTARSITESDMTQRIVVKGSDEIAELTITFNEMLDRLQLAFNSQQEFIRDAGHELRTPITVIQGQLEMLSYRPERQPQTLKLVMDELDRMGRLVNDLLLLAKAERPDFLRPKPDELDWLTEELYLKARLLADRDWQLESKGLSPVTLDRQRFTQAVMNLVQNAVRHTQPGDTIAIGSTSKNGYLHFWVKDTGEGIAPADQERIFQRFARATDIDQDDRFEGAGLGLAIVKAIVNAHGGWIELSSQLGYGSTFTLVMPLIAKEIATDESDSHRRGQSSHHRLSGNRTASERVHNPGG